MKQMDLFSEDELNSLCRDEENPAYLTDQIITYIGNKRALLEFIGKGISIVQSRLGKTKLDIFDVFTGSGIVARYCKRFSNLLLANDLEKYASLIGSCYLSNRCDLDLTTLREIHTDLLSEINSRELTEGIIAQHYAPKDDDNIRKNERVFYTRANAMYIDTMRGLIARVDEDCQKFFLAPLLAEASVHANTSGVFKGFYKNKESGCGQFGGTKGDALVRIKGNIELPFPVFSNFNCDSIVYNGDSNEVAKIAPEVDLAYLDPPYNQHPYGSNYFMLNLIAGNKEPGAMSKVSGIPEDWNRSSYNKKRNAFDALSRLVESLKAKFVLISFNSEGFISFDEMTAMLNRFGKVEVLETEYNTFRGCRNMKNLSSRGERDIHVTEYLYLLEKN